MSQAHNPNAVGNVVPVWAGNVPGGNNNGNLAVAAASLVFRPGAPGPLPSNVFTDWNLLYAAYLTTSGPVIIEIDNTFAPTTVPAGAYNFRPDTQLQGTLFGSGGTFRELDLDDGVTFSGALWVKGILRIVSNSASPIVTVNPGDPVFQLILQEAASLRADGTAPFILNRNAFPGVLLTLTEGAAFETGTSAVLEMSDESPASTFTLFNLEDSVVEDDTIDGAGIAFVTLGIASPAARFSLVQPGFSSTLGPLGQIAPSNQLINQIWNMRGFGGGAAVAVPNDCFRVTAGGGTITLPPSTEVFSGSRVRVKNRAGAGASTTIAPSGADMIDGVAAPFVTPGDADEFFEFVLDAPTGDWMVLTAGGSLSQDAYVSLSIRDATFASIGGVPPALAVSRNAHLLAAFDDTVSENVSFEAVVPPFYNAGASLRVDIDWVAATAVAGDVEWEVSFERVAPGGQDIDADGFAAAKTVVDTTDPTSGVVTRSTITFTNAEADSVTPGDDFRLRIVRDTAVGGNMVGDAQILAVQVTEV